MNNHERVVIGGKDLQASHEVVFYLALESEPPELARLDGKALSRSTHCSGDAKSVNTTTRFEVLENVVSFGVPGSQRGQVVARISR